MAGTSDAVFLRSLQSGSRLRSTVCRPSSQRHRSISPARSPTSCALGSGCSSSKTEATIDPSTFAATRAEAQSLAVAALVTGETLAALRTLGEVLEDLDAGNVDLADLSKVIRQIDRIIGAEPGKPPSAYSIAKLLLILSGDADEPDNKPPARKLVLLLKNSPGLSDAQVAEPQMILGLAIMAVGTILDRSFAGGGSASSGAAGADPPAARHPAQGLQPRA